MRFLSLRAPHRILRMHAKKAQYVIAKERSDCGNLNSFNGHTIRERLHRGSVCRKFPASVADDIGLEYLVEIQGGLGHAVGRHFLEEGPLVCIAIFEGN